MRFRFASFLSAVSFVFLASCSSSSGSSAPDDDTGIGTDDSGAPGETGETADDSGNLDSAVDAPTSACTAALTTLLGPIAKVSTGAVTVLDDTAGVKKIYIDASAGGFGKDGSNPRVYVDLSSGSRVDIDDVAARTSTAWDLAFKRPVIFSNDGDGGPGGGGVLLVHKAFDAVTSADATGDFKTESFVDAACNPKTDPTGSVLTTMSNWYDYDAATSKVTPKPTTTWIIRGGTAKIYKLAILDYYATPTGGTGSAGGTFLVQVGAL